MAHIKPDVVFISEHDANHNHSDFIQRLQDSLPFYFNRWPEEERILRGEIGNIVGCEGKDRVVRHLTFHQWLSLFRTAPFIIPIPLHTQAFLYREENGCLVLNTSVAPMFISAWKFDSVNHFDSTSFSSLLRGINPGPPLENTVQPIPVLKQHSSLNRVAAFAEIYDMLEDICFNYEIPLALTWVCGANRTLSSSYQKLTLSLETASSYYDDEDSCRIMEKCSEHDLEEGQGIAGKALQSNEPFFFEPDITQNHTLESYAVFAICLKNNYNDDVYVIEFFIPISKEKPMTPPESLARDIFDNLSNKEKRFVTLRNHASTTVDSQKEAEIPNINQHDVTMPMRSSSLPASYPVEISWNASPFDHNQQLGETSNSKSGDIVQAAIMSLPSSLGMVPIKVPILMPHCGVQQTQGPHDQLETGNYTSLEPIGNNEADLVNELPRSSAKKRKLKSKVWDEFRKVEDPKDGKVWAICSHCNKKFDGSSTNGTTHLRNHLNIHRKSRGTKVMKDSELTLVPGKGSELQSVGEGNSSFDQDRSRMDVARMFIEHQLPLNMVESESFSNLLKNLQPKFKVQSQEALSSDILRVYKEEKGRLIQYFDNLSCRFNLAVSLWTQSPEKVTYACFAVQFVDDNWALKKKIIAFKSLGHENDFGPNIFLETFESLLADWKLDKKLCSLTIRNFASSSLDVAHEEIRKTWQRFEASYPLSTFCVSLDGCINGLLAMNNDIMRCSSACLLDIHDIYKKQSQRDYPLMSVRSNNSWKKTCSLILAIAAILDPRFKFDLVEFSYSTIYGPDSAGIDLAMIRHTLANIFNEYASNIYSFNDTNALASPSVVEEKTMETFQKWYNSKRKINTRTSELDKYLQEPLICSETEQFKVLNWWGEQASKFPILGRMARDILAIPMSTIIQASSSNEKVMMHNPIFKGLNPQIIEAMICSKDWLESPQETSNVEPDMRENTSCPIVELKEGSPLAHPSELDHLTSESEEETPSLPMESSSNRARTWSWSKRDVRTYLMSPLTRKEIEDLSKWQNHQISGVLEVGPDKILDKELAPLLMIPPSDDVHLQNRKQYYIGETVVNQFFILLQRRYDKFPHKYLKPYSFDSTAATHLFKDKTKDFSRWVKPKELVGVSKVFLPICLNEHWLLFCADIDKKRLLWLDSKEYSQLNEKAFACEKEIIRRWFLKFVLPTKDDNQPNDWSYIPTKVPIQKNDVDCGLFVMKYADCLTHGNSFPFTEDDMPHFRRRTFIDLIRGRIHS